MNIPTYTKEQLEAKKVLLWMSFECATGGNPAECPLHSMRLRSYSERRRMIDQMSGEECVQLYALHRICLVRKENPPCSCHPAEPGLEPLNTNETEATL